jgi:MOSC domain-containing protein YiiM
MRDEEEGLRGLLKHRATPGRLEWIGMRPGRHAAMRIVSEAELLTERGLAEVGFAGAGQLSQSALADHTVARGSKKRQVSLIQAEHLPIIAALSAHASVAPELLRRNLVISGINLLALRATRFRIGNAILEGSGSCDPCSKMEAALGFGGYNAMRGHGGILARVVSGAIIHVGDTVDFAPISAASLASEGSGGSA